MAFRNLDCNRIEGDEIWAFCYSKQKNVPRSFQGTFGYGDVWTWVAIDADTKLVPSWLVGERTRRTATRSCATSLAAPAGKAHPAHDGRLRLYLPVVDALWRDGTSTTRRSSRSTATASGRRGPPLQPRATCNGHRQSA